MALLVVVDCYFLVELVSSFKFSLTFPCCLVGLLACDADDDGPFFVSFCYRPLIHVVSFLFQISSLNFKSSFVGLLPCGLAGLLELVAGLLDFLA